MDRINWSWSKPQLLQSRLPRLIPPTTQYSWSACMSRKRSCFWVSTSVISYLPPPAAVWLIAGIYPEIASPPPRARPNPNSEARGRVASLYDQAAAATNHSYERQRPRQASPKSVSTAHRRGESSAVGPYRTTVKRGTRRDAHARNKPIVRINRSPPRFVAKSRGPCTFQCEQCYKKKKKCDSAVPGSRSPCKRCKAAGQEAECRVRIRQREKPRFRHCEPPRHQNGGEL